VLDFLGDAITAIDRVAEYLAGVADVAALEADSRTLDAIVLNIQNLGESARCIERIAPDVVATHASIPWSDMIGMRNKLAHGYFAIDASIVWETATRDLPGLRAQLEALMNTLAAPGG
jgi:uncharacterized protein with HEPN domain